MGRPRGNGRMEGYSYQKMGCAMSLTEMVSGIHIFGIRKLTK